MSEQDKQILKDWTGYTDPQTHFYNDEKMVQFAKYYTVQTKQCQHPFEKVISRGTKHNCTLCGENIN